LLYLQLILQVQSQLSATILSKLEHVLSFIKHAIGSEPLPLSSQGLKSTPKRGLGLKDLRIVEPEEPVVGDSDDEDEDEGVEGPADSGGGKDEMIVTAITLLLSILEGTFALTVMKDLSHIKTLRSNRELRHFASQFTRSKRHPHVP
jgi:hypothetical protein